MAKGTALIDHIVWQHHSQTKSHFPDNDAFFHDKCLSNLFSPLSYMIFQSKVILRIVSRFALPQSSPIFAIRGTPAPLLAHIGGSHKVTPPSASKLAVSDDF